MTDKEIISKYMRELGQKGGRSTLARYGNAYFGKINGQKKKVVKPKLKA